MLFLTQPENLLLSDRKGKNPSVKISDFGLSKIFDDVQLMRTACGTPGYVAPEVLKRHGYGQQVDMWSLGVITYILLCGYPPFFDQNNTELFKKIMAGKYQFDRPWWDNVSEKAKDFIKHLLVLDPSQRWTATQALNHPFIVDQCGVSLPIKRTSEISQFSQMKLADDTRQKRDNENRKAPPPRPLASHKAVDSSDTTVAGSHEIIAPVAKHAAKTGRNLASKVMRITSWFRNGASVLTINNHSQRKY